MNHTPDRLLALGFEIEGLLMLIERRDDRTPAEVYDMLMAKTDELARGVKELTSVRLVEKATVNVDTVKVPVCNPEPESTADNEIAESVSYEEEADADITLPDEPAAILEEPVINETKETKAPSYEVVRLTLNDKFRFRRSLFGGSDEDLQEALETIATLSDMEDIKDYICNDLGLDPEDEEVKDFLTVVENNRKQTL